MSGSELDQHQLPDVSVNPRPCQVKSQQTASPFQFAGDQSQHHPNEDEDDDASCGQNFSLAFLKQATGSLPSPPATVAEPSSICSNVSVIERAHAMAKEQLQNDVISLPRCPAAPVELVGGYQANFIDEVSEDMKCAICLLVIRDAVQTPCGHLFCESCIQKVLTGSKPRCPLDQEQLVFTFADKHRRREVLQLLVQCDVPEHCDWVGKLADLQEHLDTCDAIPVACKNIGCKKTPQRRHLLKHMKTECRFRQDTCQHCSACILEKNMETHLANDCPEVQITCPVANCDHLLRRRQLTRHLDEECQEREISCLFGCQVKVRRGDFQKHMSDEKASYTHFMHFLTANRRLESSMQEMQATVQRLEQNTLSLREELERKDAETRHLQAALDKTKTELAVNDDRAAIARLQDKVAACEQLCQRNICSLRDMGASIQEVKATQASQSHGQAQGAEIFRQLDNLDLRLLEQETTSFDGSLVWKVPNFNKLLQDARAGVKTSHYSQPFFTGRYGYKACARLYPNGDGSGHGKMISLFFVVMAGTNDAILPWPFQQRVTFTIIDQNRTTNKHISETFMPDVKSSSFQRPTSGMNVASGCPCFVAHDTLWSSARHYLKDDTMFLRIKIDGTNLSHP